MSQSAKDRILAALVPDEIVDLAKALVRIPSYTTEETPVALDGGRPGVAHPAAGDRVDVEVPVEHEALPAAGAG